MIPLILSQPGTAAAQTPSVQEAGVGKSGLASFGDVMAREELAAEEAMIVLEDGTIVVPVSADDDVLVPLAAPVPAKDTVPDIETPRLLPEKAAVPAVGPDVLAPRTDKQVPSAPDVTLRPDVKNPPARDGAVIQQQAPDVARAGEAKPTGTSVAQALVEGRMPPREKPQEPPAQNPQVKRADRPQPEPQQQVASLPLAAKPATEIPEQVRKVQNPHLAAPEEAALPPREDRGRSAPAPAVPAAAAVVAAPTQPPAVALAQSAAQPQGEGNDKSRKVVEAEQIPTGLHAERQISAPATQTSATPAATPETARQAATQIALAVTNSNGKSTEIALNPEELGRVKLSLSAGDSMITVSVLAERPETQDLLRRHIDILAQEFRQLGYTSISFSFGEQKGQAQPDGAHDNLPIEPELQETTPITQGPTAPAVTGLDLRV